MNSGTDRVSGVDHSAAVDDLLATARVRVVVLNFDGGSMTLDCLDSLLATDWPADRLEIVLVDNGSLDDVVATVAADGRYGAVRIVEPLANLGFAGGCNLGIALPGEHTHVALVNNDATVEPGWLRAMMTAIAASSDIGAVSAKMLFAERAQVVDISVPDAAPIYSTDPRSLGVRIVAARLDGERNDRRIDVDEGFHLAEAPERDLAEEMARWSTAAGRIFVTAVDGVAPARTLAVRVTSPVARTLTISTGVDTRTETVGPDPMWIEVGLDVVQHDIINNVGSELYRRGFSGDRGFQQVDHGQFDTPAEVFAWCGGAVLLSRDYLDDVGLFDDRFFLYYEDTDLSWRGRLRGWRYVYEPGAVVRHRHAASSGVGSDVFRFHTERNRLLTVTKNAPWPQVVRTGLGQFRRLAIDIVRHLVVRPLTLRMPLMTEVRNDWQVTRSYLQLLPAMLRARYAQRPTVARHAVIAWEVDKWAR